MRYNSCKIIGGSEGVEKTQITQTTREVRMDSQTRPSRTQPDKMAQTLVVDDSDNLGGSRTSDILGSEAMKITAIYDNGGRTFDRFTVLTKDGSGVIMALGLSLNPEGPQGFSQWGEVKSGTSYVHFGRLTRFEELTEGVQRHIAQRVFGKDE